MVPGYSTSSNECMEAPPAINTSCGAIKTAENGVANYFSAVCPSYWKKITLGGSTLDYLYQISRHKAMDGRLVVGTYYRGWQING